MGGGTKTALRKKSTVAIVLALILIVAAAVLIVPGTRTRILSLISPDVPEFTATEFSFNVGRDRVFAYLGNAVIATGSLGIQVFDVEGRETLRESFRLVRPGIAQAGEYAIVFDIDGASVRVFSATEIIASIEAVGRVVTASINNNGWFCIVTQEGGGSRGTARVYNSNGNEVYTVTLGSGFVLSAKLSHDNGSLAILNLTPHGSRVSIYRGLDEAKYEPDYVFELHGGLIVDIFYLPDGNILALSTDSLLLIDRRGIGTEIYTFYDNRIGGYAFGEDFIALHLYDYGIGYSGRLITLQTNGEILGEVSTERDILSMSSGNNILMTLQNDGLSFYTYALEEIAVPGNAVIATGANNILPLSENIVLATNDHSAIVIRLEEEG